MKKTIYLVEELKFKSVKKGENFTSNADNWLVAQQIINNYQNEVKKGKKDLIQSLEKDDTAGLPEDLILAIETAKHVASVSKLTNKEERDKEVKTFPAETQEEALEKLKKLFNKEDLSTEQIKDFKPGITSKAKATIDVKYKGEQEETPVAKKESERANTVKKALASGEYKAKEGKVSLKDFNKTKFSNNEKETGETTEQETQAEQGNKRKEYQRSTEVSLEDTKKLINSWNDQEKTALEFINSSSTENAKTLRTTLQKEKDRFNSKIKALENLERDLRGDFGVGAKASANTKATIIKNDMEHILSSLSNKLEIKGAPSKLKLAMDNIKGSALRAKSKAENQAENFKQSKLGGALTATAEKAAEKITTGANKAKEVAEKTANKVLTGIEANTVKKRALEIENTLGKEKADRYNEITQKISAGSATPEETTELASIKKELENTQQTKATDKTAEALKRKTENKNERKFQKDFAREEKIEAKKEKKFQKDFAREEKLEAKKAAAEKANQQQAGENILQARTNAVQTLRTQPPAVIPPTQQVPAQPVAQQTVQPATPAPMPNTSNDAELIKSGNYEVGVAGNLVRDKDGNPIPKKKVVNVAEAIKIRTKKSYLR